MWKALSISLAPKSLLRLINFKSVPLARQKICVAGYSKQRAPANAARYSRPMRLPENFQFCQTNGLEVYQPLLSRGICHQNQIRGFP